MPNITQERLDLLLAAEQRAKDLEQLNEIRPLFNRLAELRQIEYNEYMLKMNDEQIKEEVRRYLSGMDAMRVSSYLINLKVRLAKEAQLKAPTPIRYF